MSSCALYSITRYWNITNTTLETQVLALKLKDSDMYHLGGRILYVCAESLADMTRWEIAFRRVTSDEDVSQRRSRRRRRSTKTKRRRVVRSSRMLAHPMRERLREMITNSSSVATRDVKGILENMSTREASSFVEGFCNWKLEEYEIRFDRTETEEGKSISSETMESRFQWYDEFVKTCEISPICDMQPETWKRDGRIIKCMAKMFCATTRDHMNRLLLEKDETILAVQHQNQDDQFHAIRDKIKALTLCLRFEKRVNLDGAISVAFDGQLGSYVNQEIAVLRKGIDEAMKREESVDMGGTNVFASMRIIFKMMENSLSRVEKLNHIPTLVLLHQSMEEILRTYADHLRREIFSIEPSLPYVVDMLTQLRFRRTIISS